MPANSFRELIIANAAAALANITVAGGCSVDIVTAERGIRMFPQVETAARPYVGLISGIGTPEALGCGLYRMRMPIRVVGYLDLASDITEAQRETALNAFL